jgi:hypothetical protein
MSYGELQPVHEHEFESPDAPWRRADTCREIERAAAELARELSDRLGWKVKVEVTARLGGQIASSAMRAVPDTGPDPAQRNPAREARPQAGSRSATSASRSPDTCLTGRPMLNAASEPTATIAAPTYTAIDMPCAKVAPVR